MKNLILTATLAFLTSHFAGAQSKTNDVRVTIDLNAVKDDKVMVTVVPPKITSAEISYKIPKIIPGTYSEDDYGKFVDNLKAFDAKGNALVVAKMDDNSWTIREAKKLARITYWVNDTYDIEDTHDVFSPAGTNILEGTNFLLNMHGFVGYFDNLMAVPYHVTVAHPSALWGATSMTDTDASDTKDVFTVSRYAELIENPVMYAKPDYTTFKVGDMEILIAVYSPTGAVTAQSITPDMKRMVEAQKQFLGNFNSTKKYSVLLYLSDVQGNDARGFGALEHPTATTVVLPEMMPADQLAEQLKDIVSHEFFHIVTPLSIHSKEIHFFDYNNPKMSQHLWMYEGVTEYFANLFQINQGLITEDEFYTRLAGKIANASMMNDTMSFTQMSANVLRKPYKDQYLNVYEKGALIGMCVDIIIREKSGGKRGILDLMQKLSVAYGPNNPFDDSELFGKVTELTYPEVGEFLKTYVAGETPIPYADYFARVGVKQKAIKVPGNVFLKGQMPYITVNPETREIVALPQISLPEFYTTLGIQGGDVIQEINGTPYNLDNIYDMIMGSQTWKEDDPITVKIKRDGAIKTLSGKIKLPYEDATTWEAADKSKEALRQAWLKG